MGTDDTKLFELDDGLNRVDLLAEYGEPMSGDVLFKLLTEWTWVTGPIQDIGHEAAGRSAFEPVGGQAGGKFSSPAPYGDLLGIDVGDLTKEGARYQ
jgi:hypothetical protein